MFYVLNILKKPVEQYVSKVAFVQSWVTLTLPGILYLIGVWQDQFIQRLWLIILLASIIYFIKEANDIKDILIRFDK